MNIIFYITNTPSHYDVKTLTNARSVSVTPRDIVDPYSFSLPMDYNAIWFNYNYAYIPEWNIYYFVDKEMDGKRLKMKLQCDPIATGRADIKASIAHVVRSTSNGDAYISDPMISVKPVTRLVTRKIGNGWTTGDYYILTIGGK